MCKCYLEMSGSLHLAYLDTTRLSHSNDDRRASRKVCASPAPKRTVSGVRATRAAVTPQLKEVKKKRSEQSVKEADEWKQTADTFWGFFCHVNNCICRSKGCRWGSQLQHRCQRNANGRSKTVRLRTSCHLLAPYSVDFALVMSLKLYATLGPAAHLSLA